MKIVKFPEANRVLTAEGCLDLPVFTDGAMCISKWEPDEEDRKRIAAGAPIWLMVVSGNTQPPVCVTTDQPFTVELRESGQLPGFVSHFRVAVIETTNDFLQNTVTVEVTNTRYTPERHVATFVYDRGTGRPRTIVPLVASDDGEIVDAANTAFQKWNAAHEQQHVVNGKENDDDAPRTDS